MNQVLVSKAVGVWIRNILITSSLLIAIEVFTPIQVNSIIGISTLISSAIILSILSRYRTIIQKSRILGLMRETIITSIITSIITTIFLYLGWIQPIGALAIILALGGITILKLSRIPNLYRSILRPFYSYTIVAILVSLIIRGLEYNSYIQSIPWALTFTQLLAKVEMSIVAHIIALTWVVTALDRKVSSQNQFPAFKYGFLVSLFVIAITSLKFDFLSAITFFDTLSSFVKSRMFIITLTTILFGFFTFWFNRELVEKEIEDEKDAEEKAELKRAKDFDKKFHKLSWFNFSYGVLDNWKDGKYFISILRGLGSPFIWFIRLPYSSVKWCYKEGWWYSGLLILSISIGIYLRIKHIFLKSPWHDEGYSIIAAQRISEGFGNFFPSGNYYGRSDIFHYYLSFFTQFSDNLYGWGVIANTPFFVISSIIIYILIKNISNKQFAILGVILFSFSWFAIAHFRMIRMYEMFISCFLLTVYYLLILISKYNEIKISKNIKETSQIFFNFIKENYIIIFLCLLSFYLSYDTQDLIGFLIPSIIIASLVYFLINPKINIILLCGTSVFIWIFATYYKYKSDWIDHLIVQKLPGWAINYESQSFLSLWNYLIQDGHYYLFISFLIIISLIFINMRKVKHKNTLTWIVLISLGYYSMVALQGIGTVAPRYLYPFIPLVIIVSAGTWYYLLKLFPSKKINYNQAIIFLILLLLLINVYNSGIKESNSVINSNSKLSVNNMEYRKFFTEIEKLNLDLDDFIIAGDDAISILFYIETKIEFDYSVMRNLDFYEKEDFYLNTLIIGFNDFNELVKNQEKDILFLYDGRWNRWQEGRSAIFSNEHEVIAEFGRMKLLKFSKE